MRIAVIGSGISGLGSAYLLNQNAEVHLFECDNRLGGHSHTVEADFNGTRVPVDTGFIVFNPLNYPNLVALFEDLEVPWIDTDMSFAVSLRNGGCEYEGSLGGLLAQPANLMRLRYWAMLRDLTRFYKSGYACAFSGPQNETLADFLKRENYGPAFIEDHLLPMGAAIWSCSARTMMDYPVRSLLQFLENHKLLNFIDRPQWRTVKGGSREYVNRIAARLGGKEGGRIHLNSQITGLRRGQGGVILSIAGEGEVWFDKVVMAAHADQSLALISDATDLEREILSGFRFQPNLAVLHSDPSLMPQRRAAWGSWNYIGGEGLDNSLCLTYWMNRLQSIDEAYPLFETLNPHREPDPALVHGSYNYSHPVFDERSVAAQGRLMEIQGAGNLYFAGAWTGHGFHEDGLKSAVRVALSLGARIPWLTNATPYPDPPTTENPRDSVMTSCQLVRSRIDHTRHGRPSHFLSRRGLSILIDLDRLEAANAESAFFSVDRFNLLSFHQADYGPNFRRNGAAVPLADYARGLARELCPGVDMATVTLLTFPRILGVAFNPVSVYLLRDRDGRDAMYIYEVRNTFGDMHSYVGRAVQGGAILEAQKIFHVSPFFPVSGEYRLRMHARDDSDQVRVLMRYSDAGAARLTATLRGTREKLTNLGVIRAIAATGQWPLRPLISIHVEAARLWWKRVPFYSRPEPPNSWSRADDVSSSRAR